MGYFSSGTEGAMYEERYCCDCEHFKEDEMCPVWAAHMLHNYEQDGAVKEILDLLIPRTSDGLRNDQCAMFIPNEDRT